MAFYLARSRTQTPRPVLVQFRLAPFAVRSRVQTEGANMPLVWRGMFMTAEQPELKRGKNHLGVLIGHGENDDITEEGGEVQPNAGGMSVSPNLESLPVHRTPRRLREKHPERFPEATGSNNLH